MNFRFTGKKFKNWYFCVIIAISLGAFYPFVHNYILFDNLKTYVSLGFLGVGFISLLFVRNKLIIPNNTFNVICFVQAIFLFFAGIILDSSSNFRQLLMLCLSWLFLLLILNSLSARFFLKNFIRFNILSAILSIIGVVLFMFGSLKLFGVYPYQGEDYIYNYGLFFIKRAEELTFQVRPAGYYDEPGSFAFIIMLLLLLNRKYFENIKWEYALIFLPLITASLAHIVTIFLFGFFFYFRAKNLRKIFFLIVGVFLIANLISSGLFSSKFGTYFQNRTIGRVENVLGGEMGASRKGGLEWGPKIFKENPFGNAREDVERKYPEFVNETFWGPLVYYGVIGIVFYLLPFLYIMVINIYFKNWFQLVALAILMANLLQRPYYMYPIFLVLIYYLFFHNEKKLITL